jgi:serine/threonine protein kinase
LMRHESESEYLRGFVSGTKQYMAPELFDESESNMTGVDTYAAAVVLMCMLTGCHDF